MLDTLLTLSNPGFDVPFDRYDFDLNMAASDRLQSCKENTDWATDRDVDAGYRRATR